MNLPNLIIEPLKLNYRMRLFLFLGCMMMYGATLAQTINLDRIEPPFWWAGMEHEQLELLIHGENISAARATISPYEGVSLQSEVRLENPNYLLLNLHIAKAAPAGEVRINFQTIGGNFTIAYELKAREGFDNRIQGVSSEDLIYLIMPDRFSNGDPSNDEVEGMVEGSSRTGTYVRHGGDLKGIQNHLDYLEDLGITTLWLNPYEENNQPHESYHGYAITNHYKVDPRFGTNQQYKELVEDLHKRDMKMIRDVIYNHLGDQHHIFKDLPAKDWVHQFDSFTKTTYRAPTLMDPYASDHDKMLMADGWFDTHMPDLNQKNPHLATYLIQNSIWWIEFAGIDGYRIDTYAYPDQGFMADWAEAILKEYPHFSFFAETWVHGVPVQSWFTEKIANKEFDSKLPGVTDFQLHYAINDLMTTDFGWTEGLAKIYYTLAKDYVYADPSKNVVFLDNHDLSRFYSVAGENLDNYKLGLGLLMTTRGIPQVYYGTEILMKNYYDNSAHDKVREEFPGGWAGDKVNKFTAEGRKGTEAEAFSFFRSLANFRKGSEALKSGKLMQFVPEEGLYVFFRYTGEETVMILMNQEKASKKVDTARFAERMSGFRSAQDVISGKTINDLNHLHIPARSITILNLRP